MDCISYELYMIPLFFGIELCAVMQKPLVQSVPQWRTEKDFVNDFEKTEDFACYNFMGIRRLENN